MALGHRLPAVTGSVAAAAVLGALLAGCSLQAPQAMEGKEREVEAHEELRALLPAELRSESTRITVGTESNYPPFTYADETGRLVGAEIELFDAASKRLGLKYTFQDTPWETLVDKLYTSDFDVVAAAMTETPDRLSVADFVDYYDDSDAIMVPAGNPEGITDLAGLCGRKVAVLGGVGPGARTSQQSALAALNEADCRGRPITIMPFATDADALTQVQAGGASAQLTQRSTGAYSAKLVGSGKAFEVGNPEIINPAPLGFMFLKGDVELVRAYQASMQSLIDDGTYARILERYDLSAGAMEEATVNGLLQ